MYKQASQQKLRFQTNRGILSSEQLWDLSQADLSSAIKAVKKTLTKNDDDELSFLAESTIVDTDNELRFNILKDVFLTKKKEVDERRDAAEAKKFEQKIITLIAEREEKDMEDELNAMSIDELKELIKKK